MNEHKTLMKGNGASSSVVIKIGGRNEILKEDKQEDQFISESIIQNKRSLRDIEAEQILSTQSPLN